MFQDYSELHADFYKKAVEIGSLSKRVSNYLSADLAVLKSNGDEDLKADFRRNEPFNQINNQKTKGYEKGCYSKIII